MKMSLTSLSELPQFGKENVRVKNEKELLDKINRVIRDGHSKLQIVTDFDHTLTRHQLDNGQPVLTSFGMFGECPSIPQHYKDEDRRLAAIYKPIESDPVMSLADKTKHMVQWYIEANNLLKGLKFPWSELSAISEKMVNCFRIGVKELIDWSETKQVPMLVFSAGLGDCVTAALRSAKFLLPHVKVVSNFLAIDENDTIVGIKGDVIHTYNKNETVIKNTEYYNMVKERSNVILMGDNLGDAGMAEGMDHCNVVIKIGFLGGKNPEANLQNYLDQFDIVLIDDPTMDIANVIVKFVL